MIIKSGPKTGPKTGSKTTPNWPPNRPPQDPPQTPPWGDPPQGGVPDPIDHFLVQLFVLIPLILRDPAGRVFFGVHHFWKTRNFGFSGSKTGFWGGPEKGLFWTRFGAVFGPFSDPFWDPFYGSKVVLYAMIKKHLYNVLSIMTVIGDD